MSVTVTGDPAILVSSATASSAFEFAQHAVGSPVFRQLNGGFLYQMIPVHFQFTFKQFKQRESISRAACKLAITLSLYKRRTFSRCLSLRYYPAWLAMLAITVAVAVHYCIYAEQTPEFYRIGKPAEPLCSGAE